MNEDPDARMDDLIRTSVRNMQLSMAHFVEESDRAFVILAAIQIDELLEDILKRQFAPVSRKSDELFRSGRGILRDFHSKIEMAFRLGNISPGFAKSLHQLRSIRNECAHAGDKAVLSMDSTNDRIEKLKIYLFDSKEMGDRTPEGFEDSRVRVELQLRSHELNPYRVITENLVLLGTCVQEIILTLCMVREIVSVYDGPKFDQKFYSKLAAWKSDDLDSGL